MGEYTVNLVGESKYQAACRRVNINEPVELLHEPDNKFDPSAVRCVDVDGNTLGYVERGSWLQRAIVIDQTPVFARVSRKVGGDRRQMTGLILAVHTNADAKRPSKPIVQKGCLGAICLVAAIPIAGWIMQSTA